MASRKAEIILGFELTKAKNELATIEARMARTTNKAGKEWDKLEKEHERVATKIGDAEEKAAEKAKKAAEKAAKGRAKNIQDVMDKMKSLGKSIMNVTAAIGAAAVAFVAVGIKNNLQDMTNYRKSLHDLENQQKRLAMQTNALGYITDETRSQFIEMQIEAEKLAWQNRFLTENDKKVEEGMMNLKVAIGATQGTIADMAMSVMANWFPSMESVESFLIENIVPALAYVQTAWENASKIWQFIVKSLAKGLLDLFGPICYFLFDYFPARLKWFGENWTTIFSDTIANVGTLIGNLSSNINESLKWIVDKVLSLFPDSWQKTFKKIGIIVGNFNSNIKSYIKNLVLEFFKLPGKIANMGSNLMQILSNIGKKIQEVFEKFGKILSDPIQAAKDWWNGELDMNLSEIFTSKTGLFDGMKEYDDKTDPVAQFGKNLVGEVRPTVDIMSGVSDVDKIPGPVYGDYKPEWKNLTDGMVWNSTPFVDPFNSYKAGSGALQTELDDIADDIAESFEKNKSALTQTMQRNFAKARDKANPEVQPMGMWEMLKLLEGSQKASTENVTSAYDRINNAVANKNPVVEILRKQLEERKKQADEQKTVEEKKVEKQSETATKTAESATSLDKIYNLLASWHLPQAAVVEG